ncbi:acyl carrier protein [Aurantivibrio plasticivorans]
MEFAPQILEYIKTELSETAPDDLQSSDNLLDSGILDSLSIVLLTEFLQTQFNVTVDPDDLTPENFETVDAIVQVVTKG